MAGGHIGRYNNGAESFPRLGATEPRKPSVIVAYCGCHNGILCLEISSFWEKFYIFHKSLHGLDS